MKKKISLVMCLCMTLLMSVSMMGCGGDESYRELKILKLEGATTVEVTEDNYTTDAYEGMNLESHSKVNVESGNITILADTDKYLRAEAGTKFDLAAEGDATNSKTKIVVESGSVTSEIQNKLSGESTYEVSTSNVTMSVRGTIFTVSLVKADDGRVKTNLNVFDGVVEACSTDADGNVVETYNVEAGKGVSITTDDTGVWSDGVRDADLSQLSPETVDYIVNLAEEHGSEAEISISDENLEQYYEDLENGVYDDIDEFGDYDDLDDEDLDDADLDDEDLDDESLGDEALDDEDMDDEALNDAESNDTSDASADDNADDEDVTGGDTSADDETVGNTGDDAVTDQNDTDDTSDQNVDDQSVSDTPSESEDNHDDTVTEEESQDDTTPEQPEDDYEDEEDY